MKKYYKIPVSWEMCGFVKIGAESLEEALSIFDREEDMIELPNGEYIDGSFRREEDIDVIEIYNRGE